MIAPQPPATDHRDMVAYEALIREQLYLLGHDIDRNGLVETPQRVARVHMEHFAHFDDRKRRPLLYQRGGGNPRQVLPGPRPRLPHRGDDPGNG